MCTLVVYKDEDAAFANENQLCCSGDLSLPFFYVVFFQFLLGLSANDC